MTRDELFALQKIRDPNFEFPDTPRWRDALRALRRYGYVTKKRDPASPEYSVLEITPMGEVFLTAFETARQTVPKPVNIEIAYNSIDGVREVRSFVTLSGARRFAQDRVGKTPEIGSYYAVSGDGIGRITARGVTMAELFPEA